MKPLHHYISPRFLKFLVVGVGNTSVNYAIFLALLELCEWHYLVAGATAFFCGAVVGFTFNRLWTFQSKVPFTKGLRKYLIIQCICLAVHSSAQWSAAQAGVPDWLSQLAGIIVTLPLNFLLMRRFVFKPVLQ